MPTIITSGPTSSNTVKAKFGTYIAKKFKDFFTNIDHLDVGFIYMGNPLPSGNSDTNILITLDTKVDERIAWSTMLAAKTINPSDAELVVGYNKWSANKIYNQYDDFIPKSDLLTSDSGNNIFSMIIVNSEGNIYKCLCNNVSGLSLYEPTNNYVISDGFIETSDGYLWKYLYNIKQSNKFLTNDWMPVPFIDNTTPDLDDQGNIETYTIEYNVNLASVIPGTLNCIVVENGGNNYIHSVATALPYVTGVNSIILNDITNIVPNMNVNGLGIIPGTYIKNISVETNTITLSLPTYANGGGIANAINIITRVEVDGDGGETVASVVLNGDSIQKIVVTSMGIGYTKANVSIFGTATTNTANARPIISSKYGHGYNPAIELGTSNIMLVKRFGDVDASEDGFIPTDTSFRQYGVLMNPHGYGQAEVVNFYANSVISQTTNLTLESGSLYNTNDFVYQGSQGNPSFSGNIVSQEPLIAKLTNCNGIPSVGLLLTNGSVSRSVDSIKYPDLEPNSGEIIYISNILAVHRSDGQAEEVKLIITI